MEEEAVFTSESIKKEEEAVFPRDQTRGGSAEHAKCATSS